MNDRFRIAVFERYNTNEWEFIKFIENTDKFGVSTNGNVIQENVQGFIIHLTREKTPKNVYRTMEVIQCTGLKDKNGKLIYEGDIIKINTWYDNIVPDNFEYRYESEKGFALYQIFFNQAKARFEAKCIKYTKEKPYKCLLEYVPTNNEVISNIYENSDLLEVENV